MDQMTSACGEANKLLAMVCQPAEVKELVSIPTHIRFWGLDSGIRHSVGGTDYGSVRVGTYMGRNMIKCAASDLSQSFPSFPMQLANTNSDDYEKHGVDLLRTEASLKYLCNLPPHRYEGVYAKNIPDIITGDAFLEKYVDHNDAVTVVDPKRSYSVKAPTRHPIYENFRVEAFKALLTADKTDEQLSALGELMYQEPNPSVLFKMVEALTALQKKVKYFLDEWPDHPGLLKILDIIASLLAMPLSTPLSKVLEVLT